MNNLSVNAFESSACADGTDLLAHYNSHFRTQAADTPGLIETSLAIRYQVYCLERKFEDPAHHVDLLEKDEFDPNAIHSLVFHLPSAEAIGTARLILPGIGADGLPIQRLLRASGLNAENCFPADMTAEVSRFAISNKLRRSNSNTDAPCSTNETRWRRKSELRGNLPCLGLFQGLLRQSIACGITHWAAVMEPKLLRLLATMGIHFTSVGPLIAHHGIRQPSYCYVPQMLETLRRERPQHWNVITNAGELSLS